MAPKPSSGAVANRRFLVLLLTVAGFLSFTYIGLSRSSAPSLSYQSEPIHHVAVAEEILKGDAIMPKLGNETLKYVRPKGFLVSHIQAEHTRADPR